MMNIATNYKMIKNNNMGSGINTIQSIEDIINTHNNIINIKKSIARKIEIRDCSNNKNVIKGKSVNEYVIPTTFEMWDNGSYCLWDVGFKLVNASEEYYDLIDSIEIRLIKDNKIIASRVTVEGGIEELKNDDIFYGGLDGRLSCSFKERDKEETTRYWKSTPFDFTTPDKAEIRLSLKNKASAKSRVTYVTEIHNTVYKKPNLVLVK